MKFDELNLAQNILQAVQAEGYETPSEIQEAAIPPLLRGQDLIGCAQTGTGKTAAFALPILHLLQHRGIAPQRKIRSLILTPTRELAMQIYESFHAYGRFTKLRYGVVFGGVSQRPQDTMIRRGIDVLVATPGRLNDLIGQGIVRLGDVEIFVLDEADRMLDMGFIHDVKKIIAQLPQQKQTLLFSATMPEEIRHIAATMMQNPERIAVKAVSSTVDTVSQTVYYVDKNNKPELLVDLIRKLNPATTLVFTRTKHGADKVVQRLLAANIRAAAIHGNKSQNNRQEALRSFKAGNLKVLVATDIAARGIDVDKLSLVINFDLPNIPETYVHRIGRTGRAGNEGDSISFCDHSEKPYLRDIEKLIKIDIAVEDEHGHPLMDTSPQAPPESVHGRRSHQTPSSRPPARRPRQLDAAPAFQQGGRPSGGKRPAPQAQFGQSKNRKPRGDDRTERDFRDNRDTRGSRGSRDSQDGRDNRNNDWEPRPGQKHTGAVKQPAAVKPLPAAVKLPGSKERSPEAPRQPDKRQNQSKPHRTEHSHKESAPTGGFVSRSGGSNHRSKPQDAPISTGTRLGVRK